MKELRLEDLKNGKINGLSKNIGAFLFEAATVALFLNDHRPGIVLTIEGDYEETFQVFWEKEPTQDILNNWNDKRETVEYASTAIAFLLLDTLTEYCFFGRAAQEDIADYLLNLKENSGSFEDNNPVAYLEVSGIWRETPGNTLNMRFNLKKRQVERQNLENFPILIVVAEFSIPKAKMEKNG
ncbi:MAG: hypothetical protein H6558_08225 [Lewinellaceae bacterium]|nr:hypothetical protein [Lewinellaceae bacterium]